MNDVLIVQTAFAGDLILTTPLIAQVASCYPDSGIDILCIPTTAVLLKNNPAVREVIVYDKRQRKPGLPKLISMLRSRDYGVCISPHRSFRSALLAKASRAALRVSFDTSSASFLYSDTVEYRSEDHEVLRNQLLLSACGCRAPEAARPMLYPDADDVSAASAQRRNDTQQLICIAPGSVWATKRWTEEGFASVAKHFSSSHEVIFIGGKEDRDLCERIITRSGTHAVNSAGELSLLGSAALIREAVVLISNDSAPVHMASAVGTPVVEIYGATAPEYGFTPFDVAHRIVQRDDLECKPCAIHGGDTCPLSTFECMRDLHPQRVIDAALELLT